MWDISSYCIQAKEQQSPIRANKGWANLKKVLPPIKQDKQQDDSKAPPLLTVFRAHLAPIVSLDFVESQHLIISASTDCSVRLWSHTGRYIGRADCCVWLRSLASHISLAFLKINSHWIMTLGSPWELKSVPVSFVVEDISLWKSIPPDLGGFSIYHRKFKTFHLNHTPWAYFILPSITGKVEG